jgi:hypothetical protein
VAKSLFVTSGTQSPTTAGQTHYLSLVSGGAIIYNSTEAQVQVPYRTAGTFSNLFVRISSNSTNNSSTITTRKNTSTNGNLTVSPGAATTGVFEDTTNTDSVTAGDTWTYQLVTTGTGTFTLTVISVLFEPTTSSDTVTRIAAAGSGNFSAASGNRYNALGGSISAGSATEANSQVRIKKTLTAKHLSVTIGSNSRTTSTTVRTRKNTANGAMSISYAGGVTGVVEEASPGTNSDSLVNNDLYNTQVATGTGTQAHNICVIALDLISSSDANIGIGSSGITTGVTYNANTTTYPSISGQLSTSYTTESLAQVDVRADLTFSDLVVLCASNTVTAASTLVLRKNGVSSALTVSITASTSGVFEDTSNTVTTSAANDDLVNLQFVTGETGTSIILRNISVYTTTASTGPQTFEGTINESAVSVSEALARTAIYQKPISDTSISVSESVATQEVYTKPISEPSVSVSESLDDRETYLKPIDESSISASDSIEGTKIPAEEEGQLYSVHLVEFPEEATDSLYAAEPIEEVEQVSTTKTHKYNVIGKVVQTRTHKYNVIQQITRTRTHKFNIIQQIIQTRTHVFSVLQQIIKTRTHKYNVIEKITRTRTHVFSVLQQVIRTRTHKFNILQQIVQTRTHKYNVIAKVVATKTHIFSVITRVTQTKTHKYNILQQVIRTRTHKFDVASSIIEVTTTKTHKFNVTSPFEQVTTTKTHKYNVIGKVIKTKTHVFSVIQRVTTTKTHKFSVLQRVLTTKTHVFSVIARVLTSKTHIYNVIKQIVRTRTHKYNVIGRITQTKTHKFNIITKITRTRTHKFNITIAVSPARTRTHKFSVLQLVTRARTHKYNIIGRIVRTRTHKYNMGGKVLLTKTHRFTVGFGGQLQELGGSTNAFVRFQDRVKIIDIIANIENRVFANVEIITSRPPPHKAIAVVGIFEYHSRLLTAGVHKPRHRIASRLIVPQVIDTIENQAVAPYIGIEVLPLTKDSLIQTKSHILLHQKYAKIQIASHTQIKEDIKSKIKIASATMLQQTQETVIGSEAQLEILPFTRPVLAPEIMSKQKVKVLKTLINLLSSDHLFG